MPTKDLDEFNTKIDKVDAKSKTDFVITFKQIMKYCDKVKPDDLTVLFLTDGNDTNNDAKQVDAALDSLKVYLQTENFSSRFFTIGLSAEHDAVLLSKITQAGSDLGNFFYVDYSEDNGTRTYKDTIKECLYKTFDFGVPGGAINAEIMYDGVYKKLYLTQKEDQEGNLISGEMILDTLPDGQLELRIPGAEHSLFIEPVESDSIDTAKKLKTEINIISKVLFDFIQIVVGKNLDADKAKEIYESIQALDDRVSEMIEEGFKIKNRENRKSTIQLCQAFKDKSFTVIETLRDMAINKKTLDIGKIAKLNDLAYKAIRNRGLKKKLDERAMRNEEHYKNLNNQIQKKISSFDFSELSTKYQDIIDQIGDCHMTCLNAVEAIEEGDCLGLCLDVTRSEAAIADPNQLVVKDVIPCFMSCSAYLESAAYNLERQSNAHGSFDKNVQGNLASGIGRENVTGILPLYLFDEHWEIAKRTLPSIFGFMCTLDIMGYSDDQFYIIPFTVLFKLYQICQKNESDINRKMFEVVKDTCVQIIKRHPKFREKIIEKLTNFQNDPMHRTKEFVENFRVFFAQILAVIEESKEEGFQKDGEERTVFNKDNYDWNKIIRFTIEEASRRLIGKTADIPTRRNQANTLNNKVTESIVQKALDIKGIDPNEKLDKNQMLEKLNQLATPQTESEEDKKADEYIQDQVDSMPWVALLEDEKTDQGQLIEKFNKSIKKQIGFVNVFIKGLNHEDIPALSSMTDLDLLKSKVVSFAILFQNSLQPKNKMRREAIESGAYKEILTEEDANEYLRSQYRNLLELEVSGEETKIIMEQNSMLYENISEMTLYLQDIQVRLLF